MSQTKESLEQWRSYLHESHAAETTDRGKYLDRLRSTGHIAQSRAIDEIIDLAQRQIEIQSRGGGIAKKLAINYLRDMIEELESELANLTAKK